MICSPPSPARAFLLPIRVRPLVPVCLALSRLGSVHCALHHYRGQRGGPESYDSRTHGIPPPPSRRPGLGIDLPPSYPGRGQGAANERY